MKEIGGYLNLKLLTCVGVVFFIKYKFGYDKKACLPLGK